jgi:hypothetical protein
LFFAELQIKGAEAVEDGFFTAKGWLVKLSTRHECVKKA